MHVLEHVDISDICFFLEERKRNGFIFRFAKPFKRMIFFILAFHCYLCKEIKEIINKKI